MHWGLRLLENEQVIGEEDFLKDQFFAYQGMYGIPSFCIWWMAPDKTYKIYQGMAFKLFFYRGEYDIYYAEDFIVKSAIYDTTKNLYKIYAIGTAYNDLYTTDFITATVLTNKKDQPVSGKIVLEKMLTSAFPYLDVWLDPDLVDIVGYFAISFDRDFTCLDLLTKICSENNWEWYLRSDAIFIKKCLQFKDAYITFTEVDNTSSKSIDFANYKYLELEAGACGPGALYGTDYRVIWTTYTMGGNIGGSMGVMLERNRETPLSEDAYLDTLMNVPDHLIYERRRKRFDQNSILVGKIFGKHSTDNLNNYEAPTFSGDVRKYAKWLRKREFKTKYASNEQPLLYNKNVIMSTPYAGDGVGMLFPQEESHRILIAPDGDREEPIVGPAYFGFDDAVPKKTNPEDFRLQLPSGWCLYVDKDGNTILNTSGVDPEEVPEDVTGAGENGISITKNGDDYEIVINVKKTGNSSALAMTSDEQGVQLDSTDQIALTSQGAIVILANGTTGNIEITSVAGDVKIASNVIINGGLTVNGLCKASTMGTNITPNIDTAIKTKVIAAG